MLTGSQSLTVRSGEHVSAHDLNGTRRVGKSVPNVWDAHRIQQQRTVHVVIKVEVNLQQAFVISQNTEHFDYDVYIPGFAGAPTYNHKP